jgi:hypothetical protein
MSALNTRSTAGRRRPIEQRPIQTSHPLDCLGGCRPGPAPAQVALTPQLYDAGGHTVQQIADILGVPRSTVYGRLDKASIEKRPAVTAGAPAAPVVPERCA